VETRLDPINLCSQTEAGASRGVTVRAASVAAVALAAKTPGADGFADSASIAA
jgi:hypothetical protein